MDETTIKTQALPFLLSDRVYSRINNKENNFAREKNERKEKHEEYLSVQMKKMNVNE